MHPAPYGCADELPFGVLGRPHGTSGELHLRPYHAGGLDLHRLTLPLSVTLGPPGEPAPQSIVAIRKMSEGYLVTLEGIAQRERAAQFTGRELKIPRAVLPPLREGEFYVEDLLGCVVQDGLGNLMGTVSSLYWNGAQDVMALNDGERLIPVVPEIIVALDPSKRIVTVDFHE